MARILVIYASSHGQTRKIAERIVARLRRVDHMVDIHATAVGAPPPPDGYDAVIVGSRVRVGSVAEHVAQYVEAHRAALEATTSAFFAVSLRAGSHDPKERAVARALVDEFLDANDWRPEHVASFGGAIRNTRYGWLMRRMMMKMSAPQLGAFDPTRDYEFTDWTEVDRFADAIGRDVRVVHTDAHPTHTAA